jgi:hypothetical protein
MSDDSDDFRKNVFREKVDKLVNVLFRAATEEEATTIFQAALWSVASILGEDTQIILIARTNQDETPNRKRNVYHSTNLPVLEAARIVRSVLAEYEGNLNPEIN